MPIFKPENEAEVLKELESIENLCSKVLNSKHSYIRAGDGVEVTASDLNNEGKMKMLMLNIIRRSKNCQEYIRKQIVDG